MNQEDYFKVEMHRFICGCSVTDTAAENDARYSVSRMILRSVMLDTQYLG